jgi:hypothetical protein
MGGYEYVEPKTITARVRAAIKAAQKAGTLDPQWVISARTDTASMYADVIVTVRNASDEFLFIPGTEDRCRSQRWSEAAVALAMQLRDLMDPIADGWVDNEMHFTTLNLKPGVCAP